MNADAKSLFLGAFALLLAACGGGGGSVDPVPVGWSAPLRVDAGATGSADAPRLTVDTQGNAVAVWAQSEGARYDLWGARYTPAGGWGAPVLLEHQDVDSASSPDVAMDGAGNALVVWTHSDGSQYSIWGNRFVVGQGWGTAQQLETHAFGYATDPHLAVDAAGHAVAVWRQDRPEGGGATDIWTLRYTPGSGWGTSELLETADAYFPRVAFGADGVAVVAWAANAGRQVGVSAKHALPGGGWSATETVATWSDQMPSHLELAAGVGGQAFLIWSRSDGITGRFSVLASRYLPASGWGAAPTLNQGPFTALNAKVGMDASGNALAVWVQSDGTHPHVWTNRFTPAGGWGTPMLLESAGGGSSFRPQLVVTGEGRAVALWTQSEGTRSYAWAARHLPASGWEAAHRLEIDGSGDADQPAAALDPAGHAFALWLKFDGTRNRLWASRFF